MGPGHQVSCPGVFYAPGLLPRGWGRAWGPWEPGAVWIDLFRGASVSQIKRQEHSAGTEKQKGRHRSFSCSFGVPSSRFWWAGLHCVGAHACMLEHMLACILVSFMISLDLMTVLADKAFFHGPSHPTLPRSHLCPSLRSQLIPRLPEANAHCHQLSEVLQRVVNPRSQASIISLESGLHLGRCPHCGLSPIRRFRPRAEFAGISFDATQQEQLLCICFKANGFLIKHYRYSRSFLLLPAVMLPSLSPAATVTLSRCV